ncbi:NYN domain-containing protein [Nitrosospira sp. Nsp2]|uniref:NYN domain-containing protein n=1 Tax=Nitrosospira sp. Nsp2 TaxID=136548 RepID=UPI000D2F682A|nr:NYN domain-containing protein [Nitrosospira sp. Nsp2]
MAAHHENISMAVFCDFENVALGVRDAKYEKFDIEPVLERLLLKGSIVVKKAYCDWDRYKTFKATMHEANFELIEIPHVRQSGKNSADIRLVVDALDLCYTKSHVNTFVIISGDSDFSPLVSKLRENAKQVIGVGVKQSTSDLLIANCDEFIFYDDLVREIQRAAAKRDSKETQPSARRQPDAEKLPKEELEARKSKAINLAVQTFDALVSERGDSGKIWASTLKQAIKRRKPDFNETYFGFRAFGNLLEEAQARGLLELGRDEKSGTYVYRGSGEMVDRETATEPETAHEPETAPVGNELGPSREPEAATITAPEITAPAAAEDTLARHETRSRRGGGRIPRDRKAETASAHVPQVAPSVQTEQIEPQAAAVGAEAAPEDTAVPVATATIEETIGKNETRRRRRDGRKLRDRKAEAASPQVPQSALIAQVEPESAAVGAEAAPEDTAVQVATPTIEETIGKHETRRRRHDGRKLRGRKAEAARVDPAPRETTVQATPEASSSTSSPASSSIATATAPLETVAPTKPKTAARSRRPRKTETTADGTG